MGRHDTHCLDFTSDHPSTLPDADANPDGASPTDGLVADGGHDGLPDDAEEDSGTAEQDSGAAEDAAIPDGPVVQRPDSPVLREPADGSSQYDPYPQFFWSTVPDAWSYDIQIATDPAFSAGNIVDEDTVEIARSMHDSALAPGTYYWRVRSRLQNGVTSLWSATYALTINVIAKIVDVPNTASQGELQQAITSTTGPAIIRLAVNGTYSINNTLNISGKTNFILDGQGSKMTCTNPTITALSVSCTHCAVRNISIDYNPIPHSIGVVQAKGTTTIDVKILPGYPVPTADRIMNAPQNYGYFIEHDPNRWGRLAVGTERVIPYTPVQTLDAANRLYRLTVNAQAAFAQQGYYFLMYGRHNGSTAIRLAGARFATLDHGIMFTSPAAVIAGGNKDNLALLHSGLTLAQGRPWGSNGDTVHLYMSRLGPLVEGMVSEGCGNDTMNLYSAARYITNKPSDTVMTLSSVERY